ncbi:MAG: hypothetical protein ACAI25_12930, partial [Planctomycetota bacterium]
ELGDPQRLMVHLRRLSELLTGIEELRPARIPPAKLVPALLAVNGDEIAALPEEQRGPALRAKLIPELATDLVGKTARQAFEHALGLAREDHDRIALIAGRMFMDMWLRTKKDPQLNPAWEAVFGISLLDALFEGHLISKLVRDTWTDEESIAAKNFAKALTRAEVSKELETLGLDKPDPQVLAKEYTRLGRETEKTYLLGFDSLLNFVRANADFSAETVKTILSEGVSKTTRERAVAVFDEAYKNDMTKPLADDLANEITRRLQAIAKGDGDEKGKGPKPLGAETPEDEKRVALTALASLRSIPIDKNVFLKGTYLGSFDVYKNVAPVEEVPFIRRVWAEPTDRWALEEYEKFLLERRHSHRAGRVRRYLAEVRKEAREKQQQAEQTKS